MYVKQCYYDSHDAVVVDKHETSQNCANYPHLKSSRHESLRKWKSNSELLSRASTHRKINSNTMGNKVSRRWQSADNITVSTEQDFGYRPLSKVNVLVNRDEVMDEEHDYDLLESSSAASETNNDEEEDTYNGDGRSNNNNLTERFSTTSNDENNYDDDGQHNNTENSHRSTTTTTFLDTPQLNDTAMNDDCNFFIRKFSTLPRVKSRESFTRCDNARKSCKLSSHSEVTKLVDTLSDCEPKVNNKMKFQCTTLPKANFARSRLSEPHLRHSLREKNIDLSDNLRKHSSEYGCGSLEGNNATLIVLPTASGSRIESTSGTGKLNNRQTANCVYVQFIQ